MNAITTMNASQRFHAIMEGRPFDRLPLVEWAAWWQDQTVVNWHQQGLPKDLTDRYDICEHFGLELWYQDWLRPRHWECPGALYHGGPIINDERGYNYENIHQHLFNWPVDKQKWAQWAEKREQRDDVLLWFSLDGFFWFPRTIFGIENHLLAFYDEPELMHRMNDELANWMISTIDTICEVCTPDFMTFAEDMSYNNGPMLSEDMFNEFMLPYYQRVVPHLKKKGIKVIVDSDGDITEALPWFEAAGVEGILPLERQAGVDIDALQSISPDMCFVGHFDKLTMDKGEERMRQEFERLLPAASKGRFIPSCDHQTPPAVSYDDYKLYMELFTEYAHKAGALMNTT